VLRPLRGTVVVAIEQKSEWHGLALPERQDFHEDSDRGGELSLYRTSLQGHVLAVGQDVTSVAKGDEVFLHKWAGTPFACEGRRVVVCDLGRVLLKRKSSMAAPG
jgi:co-chaperonin GroES (HSP10)